MQENTSILHIGCVQVAVKPFVREGLNASILTSNREIRHIDFHDLLYALLFSLICFTLFLTD